MLLINKTLMVEAEHILIIFTGAWYGCETPLRRKVMFIFKSLNLAMHHCALALPSTFKSHRSDHHRSYFTSFRLTNRQS